MKLTFINSNDEERELGIFDSLDDAEQCIRKFLADHNYKFRYFSVSFLETKAIYDVGSWSEFFVLYKKDDVELNKTRLWGEVGEA